MTNYDKMFHLDTVPEDSKLKDDMYTIITGTQNLDLKGNIYLNENSTLISKSFGSEVIPYEESSFKNFVEENVKKYPNYHFTPCFEGPLIRISFHEGKLLFSNYNRVNCKNSFWGNKEETFEKLFYENGGQKFVDSLTETKESGYSHHFMIVKKNLLITSRIDMRNNETIIVYLGTTTLEGQILEFTELNPEIHFYNHDKGNVFPLKEELAGRILIPTKIKIEEAFSILTRGYETLEYDNVIPRKITNGECVIFRNGTDGIVKFTPENYEIRSLVAGKTPNVKSRLYNLLEEVKNKDSYDETFPSIGVLEDSKLELIKMNSKNITTFNVNKFISDKKDDSVECKMNNIVVVCILCCPLSKVDLFIDAWFDYKSSREKICNFIKKHNSSIRTGGYDDKLNKFHLKALNRLKDLAKVSKNYASDNSKGYTYNARMAYSLKGLLRNEFGPSLYRIEKAISSIQV